MTEIRVNWGEYQWLYSSLNIFPGCRLHLGPILIAHHSSGSDSRHVFMMECQLHQSAIVWPILPVPSDWTISFLWYLNVPRWLAWAHNHVWLHRQWCGRIWKIALLLVLQIWHWHYSYRFLLPYLPWTYDLNCQLPWISFLTCLGRIIATVNCLELLHSLVAATMQCRNLTDRSKQKNKKIKR